MMPCGQAPTRHVWGKGRAAGFTDGWRLCCVRRFQQVFLNRKALRILLRGALNSSTWRVTTAAGSGEGALRQAVLTFSLADLHHSFRVMLAGDYHYKAPRPGCPSAKFADCFFGDPGIFVGLNFHVIRKSLIIKNHAQAVDVLEEIMGECHECVLLNPIPHKAYRER
jgi:hypothetical protein